MPILDTDSDRYGDSPRSVLTEAVHNGVRDLVRRRWRESGLPWRDFVFSASNQLITKADFEAIERSLLDFGYRFRWSSLLSVRDRPAIYQKGEPSAPDADFSFEHPDAITDDNDAARIRCGQGDNVVRRATNIIGTASYIRNSEKVLHLMATGVPRDLIAIIDDSGGTLTAPILEQFHGVICAGGTVRSHLGILTREYGIPCLMNAKVKGIREGDLIEIETSATAKTTEDYQRGAEVLAAIWRLSK
jgi:phosphohistidine swiveling domain-containing protein